MIRNSRQASASRKTREELLHAAAQAPAGRRSHYFEVIEEITHDLDEYEAINEGRLNLFKIASFDDLGPALVKARLARGWTHRQLAAALEVSEQMVQRDEARLYEHAGLARIAEVADVLGYDLAGCLHPVHLPPQMWQPQPTSNMASFNVNAPAASSFLTAPIPAAALSGTSTFIFGIQSVGFGEVLSQPMLFATGETSKMLPTSALDPADNGLGARALDSTATVRLEMIGDDS
jgi:transcriptional regulator with XRE-family HTH domain